jgi:hypothetical protein
MRAFNAIQTPFRAKSFGSPFTFVSLVLALACSLTVPAATIELTYRETTAGVSTEYITEITRDEASGAATIVTRYPSTGETHHITFAPDSGALSWTYRYPDGTTKDFRRDGNRVECTTEGASGVPKIAIIDSLPWFASLNYGLSELARKGVMEQVFWVVNPDNGKPYKMAARVLGEDTVAVGGVSIPAIRVRMGVHDLPTAFFEMDFWYRKGDFALVKSVGAEDGPGSPVTVVELVGP